MGINPSIQKVSALRSIFHPRSVHVDPVTILQGGLRQTVGLGLNTDEIQVFTACREGARAFRGDAY